MGESQPDMDSLLPVSLRVVYHHPHPKAGSREDQIPPSGGDEHESIRAVPIDGDKVEEYLSDDVVYEARNELMVIHDGVGWFPELRAAVVGSKVIGQSPPGSYP